ncbi:MAG: HlyD family secretion protein [Chlamydiota bacterium]|jgi:membrane fusion protein (multidrug efflux system)
MNKEKPTPFFQKKGVLLLSIFFVFVTVAASFWYYLSREYVWTNDAYIEAYSVQLSSDIEARIINLFVDEGDFVKKGELICELDQSILLSQKREALTKVELLEKQVKLDLIQMEKQRDIYRVAKKEFQKQIISFLDFDVIEKDYKIASANFQVSQANLENGIAQLEVIKEKLCHTKVFAPRDGMIAKRWVLSGDVVKPGQPLFTLYDLNNIWVTARMEETKMENVKIGSEVKIHVDTYPGKKFHGNVFVIKTAAASQFALIPPENATGNFTKVVQRIPVKIHINIPENSDPLYLFPGMSTEVKIKVR